jgi:prephenate dehydrogenase
VREPVASLPFSNVGIVGLGLMGGSLARSLRTLPTPPRLRGLTLLDEERDQATEEGVVDEAPREAGTFLAGLDLIVYGTPLNATLQLMEDHRDLLDPSTTITDLASLKAPVLEKIRDLGLEGRYVGCHPMAGGEKSGLAASHSELYRGRKVWLVADSEASDLVGRIHRFWASVGADGVPIDAWEHDRHMAWVSHLPQLTSNALAEALAKAGFARDQLGPGGMDMTRLSASNPSMWADLFRNAPGDLSTALAYTERTIGELKDLIREGRIEDLVERMQKTLDWSEGETWK